MRRSSDSPPSERVVLHPAVAHLIAETDADRLVWTVRHVDYAAPYDARRFSAIFEGEEITVDRTLLVPILGRRGGSVSMGSTVDGRSMGDKALFDAIVNQERRRADRNDEGIVTWLGLFDDLEITRPDP